MVWQPSEDELQKGASHVAYEIRTFHLAWEHQQSNQFAYTAWFVHCRNLMGFSMVAAGTRTCSLVITLVGQRGMMH